MAERLSAAQATLALAASRIPSRNTDAVSFPDIPGMALVHSSEWQRRFDGAVSIGCMQICATYARSRDFREDLTASWVWVWEQTPSLMREGSRNDCTALIGFGMNSLAA